MDRQARTLIKLMLRIRSYGHRGGPRGTAPRAAAARRAAALESIYSTHADVPDFPREKSLRRGFTVSYLPLAETSSRGILGAEYSLPETLKTEETSPPIYIYMYV